jgi:hypothetical protein
LSEQLQRRRAGVGSLPSAVEVAPVLAQAWRSFGTEDPDAFTAALERFLETL